MTKIILALGFGFTVVTAAAAQAQAPPPPPMTVNKIADDLFVLGGEGGNITVLVTNDGVVLVDDKYERNYDEIQAKLRAITDKPVKYVINTHAHADHTSGNAKFMAASAQIIAQASARATMVEGKQPGPPQITYTDQMRIFLGGKEIQVLSFGPCHTDGDTFVYFPSARVLAAGDCINTGNGQGANLTGTPTFGFYIDYATGGSLLGRAKVADAAQKLDFATLVPGHGAVADRAWFERWRTDVNSIMTRIRALVREGKTKDEIATAMINEFGWEKGGRTIAVSLEPMMKELGR
jgi:cyclase